MEDLKDIKTCELVTELRNREGVETIIVEPYQDVVAKCNGPAIVLIITD